MQLLFSVSLFLLICDFLFVSGKKETCQSGCVMGFYCTGFIEEMLL